MAELVSLDYAALKSFELALENFKQNVTSHCNTLEGGIQGCQNFMKDDSSKTALRNGQQVCMDIRACLNPTEMLLEMVRRSIAILDSAPTM